jgi:hypothetical protein
MAAACGRDPQGRPLAAAGQLPPADALLMVSGSHPARRLPGMGSLLPSSLWLLETAGERAVAAWQPQCSWAGIQGRACASTL